ncbi:MAG: Yip1 family protein, partial [Candidatus Aminicenantes bacterium]
MIRRVYFMLFKPSWEWAEIKEESPLNPRHFFSYALVFAAVSPGIRFLAGFLYGHYKRPFIGWSWAVVWRELLFCLALYFFSLAVVMLWRRSISLLAPLFSSPRKTTESLALAVFSMVPYWLGGVFYLIPQMGWIIKIIVGFYGVYILYRGLIANLMETPGKKI